MRVPMVGAMANVGSWRIANHRLAPPGCGSPREAVAAMGAVQGQDYGSALWAIGSRCPGSTEADVEKAIEARTIVRTWAMRGTLQFVAAPDYRWVLELVAPRILARTAGRWREIGLDEAAFDRSRDLWQEALRGGRRLDRAELLGILERDGISTEGPRSRHLVWRPGMEGFLCFAGRRGKEPLFALAEEWVPPAKRRSRERALCDLAQRYFATRGPATLHDFSDWAGLPVSDARAGIEAARLKSVAVRGRECWVSASGVPEAPDRSGAHLLAAFDEFLIAYDDRDDVLDPKHASKVVPGGNGMFLPTPVVEGRVVGTWKRTLRRKGVAIALSPFGALGRPARHALKEAADRYGRFLGLPAELA